MVKIDTDYALMYEAFKKIERAKSYEELNYIAYKYWGTKNAPIRGIKNVMIMAYAVVEKRKELGVKIVEMDNKRNPKRMERKT